MAGDHHSVRNWIKGYSNRKVDNHSSKQIHPNWLFVGTKYMLNNKLPLAQFVGIF